MSRAKLPVNDGFSDIEYDVGLDAAGNARVSHALNEACHVFHYHAEGRWKSRDKDAYARLLVPEIRLHRSLIKRLLDTDDRVVKSITYRAIELLDAEVFADPGTQGPVDS